MAFASSINVLILLSRSVVELLVSAIYEWFFINKIKSPRSVWLVIAVLMQLVRSYETSKLTDKLRHICCCLSAPPKPNRKHLPRRERRESAMRTWNEIAQQTLAKQRHTSGSSAQSHKSNNGTYSDDDDECYGDDARKYTDIDDVTIDTLAQSMFVSVPIMCTHGGKYGITMIDSCPAQISQLTPGSAAQKAGLRAGDVIIAINGQSVRDLDSVAVGRIIRHYPKCIVVDVFRPVPIS